MKLQFQVPTPCWPHIITTFVFISSPSGVWLIDDQTDLDHRDSMTLCVQMKNITVAQICLPFWVFCPPQGHLPQLPPSQTPQAQPYPLNLSLTTELTALVTQEQLLSLELSFVLRQGLVPVPCWAVCLASNKLVGLLQLLCSHHLQHHISGPYHQRNHSNAPC